MRLVFSHEVLCNDCFQVEYESSYEHSDALCMQTLENMEFILKDFALPACDDRIEVYALSSTHPAFSAAQKAYGLRSRALIPPDTVIGWYAGCVQPSFLSVGSQYAFDVGKGVVVDAKFFGNIMRFLNHSNTIWNVLGEINTDSSIPRIAIRTTEIIQEGEEILLNYGKGYWEAMKRQRLH